MNDRSGRIAAFTLMTGMGRNRSLAGSSETENFAHLTASTASFAHLLASPPDWTARDNSLALQLNLISCNKNFDERSYCAR
jgi:hypothetical protein